MELKPEYCQLATYKGEVGKQFQVSCLYNGEPAQTPIRLVQASPLPRLGGPKEEPFELIFVGSSEFPLPQDQYALTHPNQEVFPLFLVPIAEKNGERTYQAIFS